MTTHAKLRAIAQVFADALDRSDFERVIRMLASTCRYDPSNTGLTAEGTLVGPAAIVDSYRSHDARARRLFDGVDYASTVEAAEGSTALIRFTDVLQKGGKRHTYSCRQHITVNDAGLISSIAQEDIPSEVIAARAFMASVGVTLQ